MKTKEQQVKLVVSKHNLEQMFGIQHAERLLSMGEFQNGGWKLPADSKYYYDEENECIRLKSNKANNSETL